MAKLTTPSTAGFNGGKNLLSTPMPLDKIVLDPKISKVFKVDGKMSKEITKKIIEHGYDKSQPIVIWENEGKSVLVDGHTRCAAAKAAGLDEIPAIKMKFESFEDAIMYTFERQVIRRNLTSAEILTAVEIMPDKKERDGKGRAAEQLAERLGVSAAHIYQAQKIINEASEEVVEAVRSGGQSIKSAYIEITKPKKEKTVDSEEVSGIANSVKPIVIKKPLGAKLNIDNRDDALCLLADIINTDRCRKDSYLRQALTNIYAWLEGDLECSTR
ncbi:MAG: hypothetical protein Ta2G_17840 [Termitinemataceae bacterium]|nr:MAG: hypothetical protein Ta2G_17840 [Termitinemataceae bacterium]